ncbi:hypothetical protein LCGC14_2612290 [marine sediment metagenome]|uniref:Uncharacterized protein n=1 Tax=marine sediment metagenome TaxID=412755 RepID=A0A0F9CGM2_9ZZZZ
MDNLHYRFTISKVIDSGRKRTVRSLVTFDYFITDDMLKAGKHLTHIVKSDLKNKLPELVDLFMKEHFSKIIKSTTKNLIY